MSIDKFGRLKQAGQQGPPGLQGPPGPGFKLTSEGDFDLEGRKLCNIGESTYGRDAATRDYIDKEVKEALRQTNGHFNAKYKKIRQLRYGEEDDDAVTL